MLVLLAGKMAESFAYKEHTLGSSNDHQRWLGLAQDYLSNHFDGIFYRIPKNQFEQAQNEAKLEALQSSQKQLLKQLFEKNRTVFEELSTALLEKKVLDRSDLIPILSKVKLPEQFPQPLGEFEQFGSIWPVACGLSASNNRSSVLA